MKVKSFRAPLVVMATVAQGRSVLRGCWVVFGRHSLLAFGVVLVAAVLTVLIWPHDRDWLARLHFWNDNQEKIAHRIAWYLSTWGDFPTYNLPLALGIWFYGVAVKSSAWRRAAVVCFLGASLAGLCDDFFRLTLGRPRPDAHMPDGFYGISHALKGGFQSFPSGHAASVLGASVALLVTERGLGLVTTLYALGVVWARMELSRHYPSDVLVGSIIGISFGLLVGYGARSRSLSRKIVSV